MASALVSSIRSLSTKLLHAIRGTTSTSHQQDPPSPVRKDLEKLGRMLPRIQAVLQDAEEREIHDCSVRLWLKELRGVAYKAEDVLDEFYYEVLRSIVESGDAAIEAYHRDGGTKRKFAERDTSSSLATYSVTISKVLIPDGMAEKIKDITERFEESANARRDLHLREEDGTRLVMGPQIRPPTSSHVDERATFGREKEKEEIISLLDPSNDSDFMVLPIVGMGGFGKTTLAQLVFNDSRIHGLFNKKCWVSVSEDFDLVRLTKAIVESVSDNPCEFSELSKIQDILKEKIRDLSLFLVLDDVWNDKSDLWENLRVGLIDAKFVRILTTTRNTSAAKIMQTTLPFQLGSLPEESCWSLFKHFAFGTREASENPNLYEIGRGIVKKCKGAPLAIKVLGGILRYEMDEEKWREILESDISEIDDTGEVMPALRLSYLKLPQHLKPCFLYLSMFPKGKRFGKGMMVELWMAQGYIKGHIRNLKTLEEIGSEYFDELQGRSLIYCDPDFNSYLLHDLIHDLARSISHETYLPVFENKQQCIGICEVYQLYLTTQDKLLGSFFSPSDYCSIRTFIEEWPRKKYELTFSYKFAYARVLDLKNALFPNTLSTMKHLRYFCIRDMHMKMFPETFCLLYNLQTLDLNCPKLRELPENIKNLINLRSIRMISGEIQQLPESICMLRNLHTLSLEYCRKLKELPRGIEQLTMLQNLKLPESIIYIPSGIGKLTTLKALRGYFSVMDHDVNGGLGELKYINKLGGRLCISGLSNISEVEYSRNANLASKPNLHKLILNFQEDDRIRSCKYDNEGHLHLTVSSSKNGNNENDDKIQDVLQSLQPHGNLTELAILNYAGRNFSSWLLNPLLPKLTTLTLNFWTEPNFLPLFGQLPHLKFLEISGNASVRNVGDELSTYSLLSEYGSSKQPREPSYPSLEVLTLRNILNLVEWQRHDSDFPSLKQLTIENSPKLWKIATIPQKVREITFAYCSKLELLTCPSVIRNLKIHKCGFHEIMFGSISENLTISNCVELTSINWSDVLYSLTQRAEIYGCPRLYLGNSYVYQNTRAKVLNLFGNDEIHLSHASVNSTIPLFGKSITLSFSKQEFGEVESLTEAPLVGVSCNCRIIILASLVILEISKCIKVISVAGLDNLSNLKRLSISYCPELCNWNDKTLPLSLRSLRLCSCDKLSSFPLLWVQNHSNILKVLVIKRCPRLAVLEGFHCLMSLETVNLLYCRNISISPANESLQFRPHFTIGDCPLMRDWCQKNSITYYQLNPIDNPQDDREAEQESAGAITKH